MTAKRILTIAEVAEELGVGLSLAGNLVREGKIFSVRAGKRRLIPCEAVEAFLRGETPKEAGDGRG